MARKAPSTPTLRRLFAVSGNKCAFPECDQLLVDKNGIFVAEVCHIEAAEKGGQRYNEIQSDEDRRSFSNLIILCHQHHKITDDVNKYTVSDLLVMKENHESKNYSDQIVLSDETLDQIRESIESKLIQIIGQNIESHRLLNNISNELSLLNSNSTSLLTNSNNLNIDIFKIGIDLRNEYDYNGALSFFKKFEKDNWNKLSTDIKFKLLSNIGVTLLDMGQKEEGAIYFLKISNLDIENLEVFSYICLGYSILNDYEKFDYFFNKAKLLGNNNPNLWIAFLNIYGSKKPALILHNEVPFELLNQNAIIIKLLELYNTEGRLMEQKELLWKIENSINDEKYIEWQILITYTSFIISSVLTIERLQTNSYDEFEISQIKKAIKLYDRLENILVKSGAIKILTNVYHNRALCYMGLSQDAKAERDFEKAWENDHCFYSFKGLFVYKMKYKHFETCKLLLEEWEKYNINLSSDEKFQKLALESRLKTLEGEFDKLEILLLSKLDEFDEEIKPLILDNLILNALISENYDKSLYYANKLVNEYTDYIYGYIGLYAYNMQIKNFEAAKLALKRTTNKKYDKRSEIFLWMQIADGFCELKEYEEALNYYKKLENLHLLYIILPRYAECYYYLQNYITAINLVKSKSLLNLDYVSLQILLLSYYNLHLEDEFDETIEFLLKNRNSVQNDIIKKIGARYYSERDQFCKAKDLILSIYDFSKLGCSESFSLAHLLSSMGYTQEAFDLAYKLRVIFYDNFEAHKYYIDLSIFNNNSFKHEELFLSSVELNTMVVLKDEKDQENYFYLSGDNKISNGIILEKNEQLSTILMNAKIGQDIVRPNTMGRFIISEIWNKDLTSFRDSLFLLENKYPDKAGMYFGRF